MTQELLSRYDLPCLHTIPNGVFPEDFERVVRTPQIPGSSLVFVGRLVKNKGVHKLLEAIVGIDILVPDWTLKIVGSGPEREALESQAAQLGIVDRVEFLGHLEKDEVIDVLGQSDLAVFPSIIEPFGIVVLEAMATGVPVVISSASGIGTIFDDEVYGWKCNVENPDQLRATIITALTSPRRVEVAEKARLLVRARYDWRQVCRSVEALYRQVIGLEI
jgi:1,4-alpha-glucan branching enzyme